MMFYFSKFVGLLIHPVSLSILILFGAICLYLLRFRRFSFLLVSFAFLYLAAMAFTPLSAWIILPLEERFVKAQLPASIDGIISLGGGIDTVVSVPRGIVEQGNAADRLYETALLSKRFPDAKVVFTGGSGRIFGGRYSSADVAGQYLRSLGVPSENILLEPNARNTAENVKFTKALVKPGPDEVWIVVTSAFHMPRAIGLFRKADWQVLPWPADYQTTGEAARYDFSNDITSNFIAAEVGIKEWVGLTSYYLLGRIDTPLPGPN